MSSLTDCVADMGLLPTVAMDSALSVSSPGCVAASPSGNARCILDLQADALLRGAFPWESLSMGKPGLE